MKKLCSWLLSLALVSGLVIPMGINKVSAEEDQELSVWCWDPAYNLYAMQEAEKIYQEEHPNFKLKMEEVPWNDLQQKFNTAALAGDIDSLPDIFLMQDNAFQKNVQSFPDVFYDLSESGIKFDEFAKGKLNYSVVDGKNYGVPFDNGTVMTALRTDYLEEAGLKVEDFTDITWSDFIEKGKIIKEKTGHPALTMTSDPDLLMLMLQSAGASLFDEEGKPQLVGNDVLKKVIEINIDMITNGVMEVVNDWDQYVGSITTGHTATVINGCWILASIQTSKDQSGKWMITNIPKLDTESATNYSNNGGSSWAVTKGTGHEELASDFLAKTFASSTKLYETILPSSAAMATWLPMKDSKVYAEPQEFFQNQAIYQLLTEYASKAPSNNTGKFYYEARDAVSAAMQNTINGGDLDSELEVAQKQIEHLMQNS